MNHETKINIIIITIILIAILIMFRSMITFSENTVWMNDNFCKLKYGTDERNYEKFFGKYCAIVNFENKTIKKIYYTHEEMMDFCGKIGFFELNKWKNKCFP